MAATTNPLSRVFFAFAAAALLLVITDTTEAQVCDSNTGACDKHERCPVWKEEGECVRNAAYMAKHCPATCSKNANTSNNDARAKDREALQNCTDQHERCSKWAQLGECDANPKDMHRYCPKSCKVCNSGDDDSDDDEEEEDSCEDTDKRCSSWAKSGECKANPGYMHINCAKSCDTCDKIASTAPKRKQRVGDSKEEALLDRTTKFGERQKADGSDRPKILSRLEETVAYFSSKEVEDLPANIRRECKNRHELCTFWQVIGECEKNKAYMATNCAAACHTCHLIDVAKRCPPLEDAVPALLPGDLNQMFERIVREAPGNQTDLTDVQRKTLEETKTPMYTVHIHSRPSEEPATEVSAVNDKSLPPWVLTFDNFLTEEECDEMVQLGYKYEYKRSEDVGARKFDGTFDSVQSKGRTSENAWCSEREGCRNEELPTLIHERMARVMGIPAENSEDLQLLKYEVGQFYNTHHDYIPHQRDRQCGPRILTFFLYLSDVEAGGGTNFPKMDNLTVMPKKGRALLWPSILDSNPMNKDDRTMHQALPVEAGVKFAANGWIHMYDYVGPQKRGCN